MKALAIVVPKELASQFEGLSDLGDIIRQLANIADQAKMVLIHQDRPVTYLPFRDDNTGTGLQYNVQVELSGGIQEPGQNAQLTARRELLEEAGVGNVICLAPLYHGYLANSAGHQHERYGMELIIAIDLPRPTVMQQEEGIVTAYTIPITEVSDHIDDLARKGYLIEWSVYLAIGRLRSMILAELVKILI
jgi:8-oxo-dGTP pyrophosphatase MutT (NUDIX family)